MSWSASSGWYSWPTWLKIPNWRNIPSMPKVRLSSGTMGTTCLPIFLSRSSVLRMRTNAMVVEISRPSVPLSWPSKADRGGTSSPRLAHLFLLMGDVLALAGLAHAVALDGLGEDHGGLALVADRSTVGGVDLLWIVAAPCQRPDLVIRPVGDHGAQLGVL